MRPSEKAAIHTIVYAHNNNTKSEHELLVPSTVCSPICYFYQITAMPTIKVAENAWDGGSVMLMTLDSHCNDIHSLTARIKRAWKSFWGCPDTEVYFDAPQDVDNVIEALKRAKDKAFQGELYNDYFNPVEENK